MVPGDTEKQIDELVRASRLLKQGQRAGALAIYHEIDGEAGSTPPLQYHLGRLCEELGDMELAIGHYARAVEAEPENLQYLCALGQAQHFAGEAEQALETLQRAEALDPETLEVTQGLGSYYLARGDNEQAVDYLERALARKPGSTFVRTNLAIALNNLERHEEALEHARKAHKGDGNNPEVVLALCNTLTEMGQFEEAERLLEKTIRKHDIFGQGYDLLARIRRYSKADDSFIRRAEKVLDKGMPAIQRQALLFALGKMHDDCERYDEAFAHYRQANLLTRKDYDLAAEARRLKSMRTLFTEQTIERYREFADDTAQPVFIVGMPRAGTTLMEQMIASHPSVSAAGEVEEMHAISKRIFPPESRGASSAQLQAAMTAQGAAELRESYLAALRRGRPDTERIVDKAPLNFCHLGLIATLFPRATIIHAQRNPLDTCLSCYFQNFTVLGWTNDFETLAGFYALYRETMDHWRKTLPGLQILDLSYESLVEEPEAQGRRMIEACGLDWDDAVLDHASRTGVIKTASLAQARRPVYRSSRYRWQNYAEHLGELAGRLAPWLDDADREFLAQRGVAVKGGAGGGWLKRLFG